MFVVFAACAGCASGGTGNDNGDLSQNPTDGAVADVVAADTTRQGMPESGSGVDASDMDASDDSSGSMSDGPSTSDSSPGDSSLGDSAAPADSSVADTGTIQDTGTDTAVRDSGVDSSDAGCSAGPSPSYLSTCTSCSISVSCLLGCASCTKKDQTQNPNPVVQLPCAGTLSVENNDGNLLCN
jgi:hypothetical protein